MTSLNIKSYLRTLEQNPEYVDLLAQVNQLNKIEQTIIATDAIPAPLNRHCKLGPLSHGTLVLLAENASVATKLKHISPSILSKIRRSEWKITAVKIKLQKPDSNSHNRATQNQTINFYANNMHKKKLSQPGIESLHHLARSLPVSELRCSIQALLKKCSSSE
ncbi:MAG: DUF721 domain-containing protein [Nitrosomonas sp.]|nr:DUF721 domain-containing protein [Nitrosomonas sp.]